MLENREKIFCNKKIRVKNRERDGAECRWEGADVGNFIG